jgi:hypothetical protein
MGWLSQRSFMEFLPELKS